MREKMLWNPQIKKKFNSVQREDAYMIQPQLKVEKEDA